MRRNIWSENAESCISPWCCPDADRYRQRPRRRFHQEKSSGTSPPYTSGPSLRWDFRRAAHATPYRSCADIVRTEGAPSLRALCEGWAAPSLDLRARSPTVQVRGSHPCKERKDGAPSVVVKSKKPKVGHPPSVVRRLWCRADRCMVEASTAAAVVSSRGKIA